MLGDYWKVNVLLSAILVVALCDHAPIVSRLNKGIGQNT